MKYTGRETAKLNFATVEFTKHDMKFLWMYEKLPN